jgi:hypothetical protein
MSLAKIFTVTKNEYDLIQDWITYHSNIFGCENIIIIDNGSTNINVLEYYNNIKSSGVTIITREGYVAMQQGEHYTEIMNKYKNDTEYLIGLDTDQFFTINGVTDKDTILNYLISLNKHYDMYIVYYMWESIVEPSNEFYKNYKMERPTMCDKFRIDNLYERCRHCPHIIYRACNFISTENGNHNGITVNNTRLTCNDIVYIHYHHTGKKRAFERCAAICEGYKYVNLSLDFKEQSNILKPLYDTGIGQHRVREYINFLNIINTNNLDKNSSNFDEIVFKEDSIPDDVFTYSGIKDFFKQI